MFRYFVELLPEAIFFSLFMIYAKGIKERRLLFIALTCIDYILLFKAFPNSIYSKVGFFIVTYILLKVLYKEKAQVTDIFLLAIASFVLIISCALFSIFFILNIFKYEYCTIANRIFLFGFLFIFGYKLNILQKMYKKYWNRNDKVNKKMKSLTFRNINIISFNVMFFLMHIGIAAAAYFNK